MRYAVELKTAMYGERICAALLVANDTWHDGGRHKRMKSASAKSSALMASAFNVAGHSSGVLMKPCGRLAALARV